MVGWQASRPHAAVDHVHGQWVRRRCWAAWCCCRATAHHPRGRATTRAAVSAQKPAAQRGARRRRRAPAPLQHLDVHCCDWRWLDQHHLLRWGGYLDGRQGRGQRSIHWRGANYRSRSAASPPQRCRRASRWRSAAAAGSGPRGLPEMLTSPRRLTGCAEHARPTP